jgi:hypothetical protein
MSLLPFPEATLRHDPGLAAGARVRYMLGLASRRYVKNIWEKTVPKIVPSVRLYALSCKLGRSAQPRISTSKSERIQTALKC